MTGMAIRLKSFDLEERFVLWEWTMTEECKPVGEVVGLELASPMAHKIEAIICGHHCAAEGGNSGLGANQATKVSQIAESDCPIACNSYCS